MSSSDVEVHLICFDEASSVIEDFGATISNTFTDIEGNTQSLQSTTDDATSQMVNDYGQVGDSAQGMSDSVDTANTSCSSAAMTMNSTAMSGAMLFMSFERIQNSEISLDRAHLMVERSTLAVQKAQEAYNAAVAKNGPDSQQAKDAADKLSITQDALTVAQERLGMAQRNVNNSMLMAALTVIPSLITIGAAASTAIANMGSASEALSGALDFLEANPIVLVIAGIAALVAGLIYAYNNCKPFRDAINEIGAVLGGALKTAIDDITKGLTWLWQNVFEPLAKFLITEFVVNVEAVLNVCMFLWNGVLKPLGDFLIGSFTTAWKDLGAIFAWFYNLATPIIDAVNSVAKTLGGFVDSVAGAMKGAGKAITDFIGGICFAHALENAANSSEKTMNNWVGTVKTALDKSHAAIKGFNADVTLTGSPSLGATGIGGGSLPSGLQKPTVVNITIPGPLVNIEGSADKATADLASKQVLASLQTIIVEPTSTHAAATQKRIRSGSLFT